MAFTDTLVLRVIGMASVVARRVRGRVGFAIGLAVFTLILSIPAGSLILMMLVGVVKPEFVPQLLTVTSVMVGLSFLFAGVLVHTSLREFAHYTLRVIVSIVLVLVTFGFVESLAILSTRDVYRDQLGPWMSLAQKMSDIAVPLIVVFMFLTLILYFLAAVRGSAAEQFRAQKAAIEELDRIITQRRVSEAMDKMRNVRVITARILRNLLIERWDLSRVLYDAMFLSAVLLALIVIIPPELTSLMAGLLMALLVAFLLILWAVDVTRAERIRAALIPR